jgi:hypothetical protein
MHLETARFRFLADALHGTGGFRPTVGHSTAGVAELRGASYLIQYPREGGEKFARRNEVAWYVNDLRSACARFAGYLAKRPPQRQTANPLLAAFIDDCNWRGDALDVFWSAFTIEAKARGSMLLLVDMPRDGATASVGEVLEQRRFPYLVPIVPEEVVALDLNAQGRVDRCEIMADGGRIHGWDGRQWWVRKGEQRLEMGEHGLGLCPVLAFAENEFPREGEFSQIADLSRRLFNLHSELDEILRAQTFSLLTYQIPPEQAGLLDVAIVAAQIGTHNMLVHSGGTPAFIAPPDGPATIYLARIAALEEKIKQIGHVIEPSGSQVESGLALTLRFQQLNSSLSHWASRMADLELRVWELVTRWLGLPFASVSSTWDDDYAIADISAELEKLGAMQLSGFSDATLAAKRQQILALDLAGLPDDELAALLDAEGEGAHERDPAIDPDQDINSDGNNLLDTGAPA